VCEAEDNVDWEEDDSIYVEPKCRDKQRSSPFEGLILQFPAKVAFMKYEGNTNVAV
jgi:hypothetical protein